MDFFIGIDGGGSKTRCVLCDAHGHVLGEGLAGGSNYKVSGIEASAAAIRGALEAAMAQAGCLSAAIRYAVLGLSGADAPDDFDVFNNLCASLLPAGRFQVLNDAWIGMRSGICQNWGAVSICGTGFIAAARNAVGEESILRGESYELGNLGGGDMLARIALHHAFRADEDTGEQTRLQSAIPEAMNARSLSELFAMYKHSEDRLEECLQRIPPLVFQLAAERDAVCQRILVNLGRQMGLQINAVIRKRRFEDVVFPLVLCGSVYKAADTCALMCDALMLTVHQTAKGAYAVFPKQPPVSGAVFMAMETSGLSLNGGIYDNIARTLR